MKAPLLQGRGLILLRRPPRTALAKGLGLVAIGRLAAGTARTIAEAAVAAGVLERDRAVLETLMGFKRAGCSGVLTYYAPLAAKLLARG